jgi:GT2 family glycosyltransferase
MISIIYSTHKDSEYNNKFKQHLLHTVGVKDVQILEYVNHNQYSLSEVYNSGITESIYDIVVCCHNDIKLEKNWGKKLLSDFSNNLEFGIIGKAGSCYFPKSGVYWEKMNLTMVGQVYHHPPGQNKWLSKYCPKFPFLIPVVTIDGLFISFDKTKIKHNFDETIGKFHFYDHLFCIPNYMDGVKIGVSSSFEITHESVGQPNQEFWESKEKFLEKWKHVLPIDLKPSHPYLNENNKSKQIKNQPKVAVIIPTKNNINLLINCLNSFFKNCDPDYFEIFIADTGSSDDELNEIKKYIQKENNINLLLYDYYNFSKINNDVVKNHLSDKFEYLLFCNNDIVLLTDVIYNLITIFKNHKNVGTVGCRLHYEDNTLQHQGITIFLKQNVKQISVDHFGKNSYYNFDTTTKHVLGNTAALMMIRKNTFEKIGGFDESLRHCFEDVLLNLKLTVSGYSNYYSPDSVAYHLESASRDIKTTNNEMIQDYNNILVPYIKNNFEKLKKFVLIN